MPSTKKKSRTIECVSNKSTFASDLNDQKQHQRLLVSFILAPGASSKDPSDLRRVLSVLGPTRAVSKWKSNHPSSMTKNVEALKEVIIQTGLEFPNHKILLVGHSFGCRVIVSFLTQVLNKTKDNQDAKNKNRLPDTLLIDRAVLESYPLYGPSKPTNEGTDRIVPLQALPPNKGLKLLFFSGEKDEFLDRSNWRSTNSRSGDINIGGAALREVVDKLNKTIQDGCTIHMIQNAKHNSLKVKKADQLTVEGKFRRSIEELLLSSGEDLGEEKDSSSIDGDSGKELPEQDKGRKSSSIASFISKQNETKSDDQIKTKRKRN